MYLLLLSSSLYWTWTVTGAQGSKIKLISFFEVVNVRVQKRIHYIQKLHGGTGV